MSIIIVTEQQSAKLAAAGGPLEVLAPDGRVLGYFTPGPPRRYNLDPGISDEEADRLFAAGGGRPLADILRDWGANG